jgi:hypothetical protein
VRATVVSRRTIRLVVAVAAVIVRKINIANIATPKIVTANIATRRKADVAVRKKAWHQQAAAVLVVVAAAVLVEVAAAVLVEVAAAAHPMRVAEYLRRRVVVAQTCVLVLCQITMRVLKTLVKQVPSSTFVNINNGGLTTNNAVASISNI